MTGGGAGVGIRPAEPADLAGLLRLEDVAFASDQLDRRAFRHALRSPTILALVVPGGPDGPAGYALVQLRRGSTIGRLTSLAIDPAAQGKGLGRALLGAAEDAAAAAGCDRLRLEVRADNAGARRLYEAGRYRELAIEPDYYEDGCAAHRYEKAIR